MVETTNQLISNAYFESGIVSREFESVSGPPIANGLIWLNEILGRMVVDQTMIPYESTFSFNAVIGQEEYPITDIVSIDTLTFIKDAVRYSMRYTARNEYFGSARVENISSLPFTWYFEKEFGGGKIYMYFQPDQAYPVTVHGLFRLSEVALQQDLSLTLDNFYRTYLRYSLAEKICVEFKLPVPAGVQKYLEIYTGLIKKRSRPLDLSSTKVSTLQRQGGLTWADVNLGRGWRPI